MTISNSKVDNLSKLRMEKLKLETFCTYQEKLIGYRIDYFRENYSKVLGESLLPYDAAQNLKVSSLLDSVNEVIKHLLPGIFEGKFLPGLVLKMVQVIIINLFNKK